MSLRFAVPLFAVLLTTLALPLLPAFRARAASGPCDRPECRQFDFWLGEWDVTTPDGKPAGTNRIESILGGCVLLENWKGVGGIEGKSFNLWTASDSLWHQTWVSGLGAMLQLSGTLRDGNMVLEGDATSRQPAGTRNRITWTPQGDGSVKQHWQTSSDGGKTWTDAFVGMYRKRKYARFHRGRRRLGRLPSQRSHRRAT